MFHFRPIQIVFECVMLISFEDLVITFFIVKLYYVFVYQWAKPNRKNGFT